MEQASRAFGDGGRAETQGGTGAEQGRDDGEDVDDLALPAVHRLTEQRLEDGGDQAGVAPDVGRIGHSKPEDPEDRPGVGTPVEEGVLQGADCGVLRTCFGEAVRWGGEVADRLGHAVTDQADAHGEPGQRAELGLLVGPAEDDRAEAAEGEPDHQADTAEGDGEVGPAEALGDPVHRVRQGAVQPVRGDRRPDDECGDDGQGHPEDGSGTVASGVGVLQGGGTALDRVETAARQALFPGVGRIVRGGIRGCAHGVLRFLCGERGKRVSRAGSANGSRRTGRPCR